MNRPPIHNTSFLLCCCLTLFLVTALDLHAQEKKDTIVILDTLVEALPNNLANDTIALFDKIEQIPAVQLRRVPDSLVNQLKNDDAFWYANTAPLKKKTSEAKAREAQGLPFYRQPWFKTLLWIVIISAFVAVVIWYLAVSNVSLFRRPSASLGQATEADDHKDIFSIPYEEEINKALSANDHRLTIRLLYLQTLKMLSEKGLIRYQADNTNSDYLWQLQDTRYYQDFFRLTRDFEYAWYGKLDISRTAFQTIYNDFSTFKNRLLQ